MNPEKNIRQEDIDRAHVRLRPFLGIQPRIWLPVLYLFIVVLILFFILIVPGLGRNGSVLVFSGIPADSAVYSDGAYLGHTAERLFLAKGEHSIRIQYPGFVPQEQSVSIGGRIFGSLLFPKTKMIKYSLKAKSVSGVLNSAFTEFSKWTMTGMPSAIYQVPPVLSNATLSLLGTGSLGASAMTDAGLPENWVKSFALDALAQSTSPQAARDAMRAGILARSQGPVSPLTLLSSIKTVISVLGSTPYGALWLNEMIAKPQTALQKKIAEAASTASAQVHAAFNSTPASSPHLTGNISIAGIQFSSFSAGQTLLAGVDPSGESIPYSSNVSAFALATTETTRQQWAAFLASNPQWGLGGKDALVSRELVDDSYLVGWSSGKSPALPVTNVSFNAARAYCEWLSKLSGYNVVLPTESMWESAARAGGLQNADAVALGVWSDRSNSGPLPVSSLAADRAGLHDMLGNVWEWTSDSYFPYPGFAAHVFDSNLKAVRGGSWANASGTISYSSRGGIPAAHSSEFLGFRPAILLK
jgi:formylglycine-generating enzyme required for sulfatase activity